MSRPFLCLLLLCLTAAAEPLPLFDGKTLDGWEGDTKVWRVEDGAITGGSMEGNARNEFLIAKKPYKNFILRLEYKLVGTEGFVNGGVQFHSQRATDPKQAHEMIGYQADIGAGYSGCLNNELRKPQFLGVADKKVVTAIEKPGEWNRYEIRVEGPHVQLSINGTKTSEYTEKDPAIPLEGLIGLQIHGNCKAVISFRKIEIESLEAEAPSKGLKAWRLKDAEGELPKGIEMEKMIRPLSKDGRPSGMETDLMIRADQSVFSKGDEIALGEKSEPELKRVIDDYRKGKRGLAADFAPAGFAAWCLVEADGSYFILALLDESKGIEVFDPLLIKRGSSELFLPASDSLLLIENEVIWKRLSGAEALER